MTTTPRSAAVLALCVALLSACTSGETAAPTSSSTTTTAQTTTTIATTTTSPTLAAAELCDRLKVAAFDLDAGLSAAFGDLAELPDSDVDEDALGRAMITEIAEFYEELGSLSADAPEGAADALDRISEAAESARAALETLAGNALEGMDPGTVDPEVSAAAEELSEWAKDMCDAEIAFDPADVVLTSVMGAMFGALGAAFGDLGTLFDDALAGGLEGDGLDGGLADPNTLVYGDDPELDALWDDCGLGDGDACEELYFRAFGEYETFAQTCGGTIPFRSAFSVDCATKLEPGGPSSYGDDPFLDAFWDLCETGDDGSCDSLAGSAPFDSDYETFGYTCGDRRPADALPCEFQSSGDPFAYGDDPAFDALWDACSVGDGSACSDLYFESPFGSVYERFGSACGDLVRAGRDCARLADLLGGPVG